MKSMMAGLGGALLVLLAVAAHQARAVEQAFDAPMAPVVAQGAQMAAQDGMQSRTLEADPLPVAVRCAPGQRVVIRQIVADGERTTAAECTGAAERAAARAMDLAEMPSPVAQAVPASYTPVSQAPAPRVVSERAAKPKRSWKKTALVIGGSAGAGAGVGALAGGKKGALIGAAIGGGAASIYEAVKR
ncbi:MAG TPA: hypothetical protein VF136_01380 [Methylomirabilota bacterium]